MRTGKNKAKDRIIQQEDCEHRVIIPLHIPNEKAYYAQSFEIFKLCLQSILKTSLSPINISVISDASCHPVNQQLLNLQRVGSIDELIIETKNVGKVNAICKALKNAQERLVTITDADVLFKNGWEQAIIEVFESFPKAGAVSPVPVFRTQNRLTQNVWLDYFFSKKLQFSKVKNPKAMTRFANSIGWAWLDKKFKDVILTLESKDKVRAVVGCNHMCVTYKREVFRKQPKKISNFKLGGNSEYLYLDLPVVKMGGYRLSTYDNFAYHIGNTMEEWVKKEFKKLTEEKKKFNRFSGLKKMKPRKVSYLISQVLLKKLFYIKRFKRFCLKSKGLSSAQIKCFMS